MLPTGDLTELLGSIPADMPTVQAGSTIPQLPMDGEHPYRTSPPNYSIRELD